MTQRQKRHCLDSFAKLTNLTSAQFSEFRAYVEDRKGDRHNLAKGMKTQIVRYGGLTLTQWECLEDRFLYLQGDEAAAQRISERKKNYKALKTNKTFMLTV